MRVIKAAVVIIALFSIYSPTFAQDSESGVCVARTSSTGSLTQARALFNQQCPTRTLVDCDPVSGGGWQCASGVIGTFAPDGSLNTTAQTSTPAAEPTTPVEETAPTDTSTDSNSNESAEESTPDTPEPTPVVSVPSNSSGECYVVGTGLTLTKQTFSQQCAAYKRKDCDPLGNNQWVCSSANISSTFDYLATPTTENTSSEGSSAEESSSATDASENTETSNTDNQETTEEDTSDTASSETTPPSDTQEPTDTTNSTPATDQPVTEPVVSAPSNSSGECYVVDTGLTQSKILFSQQCANHTRKDCDPLGNNRWVCSSAKISSTFNYLSTPTTETDTTEDSATTEDSSTSGETDEDTNSPDINAEETATENNTSDTETEVDAPVTVENPAVGRLGANDLLVLHYDNCPDRDDGHAIPSGKSIVEKYGINNVLVVNGTCGNSIRDRFVSESDAVMQASWGQDYLDAHNQRAESVQIAATRWASTLSNDANVWIAEGGQSDFTADVARLVKSQYSNLDLKRIHVIQHSAGSTAYNEVYTDDENLAYLKANTSYKGIPNGNVGGNGSADLNEQSDYFVSVARASRFSTEWNAGFVYLPPDCPVRRESCKLDFSDTVEVLYIVGDTDTQSVNDFADNYLQ